VLSVAELLSTADGDLYTLIQYMAMASELQITGAEIVGNDAAAHMHRASFSFLMDTPIAIEELNAAANLRGGNPIIYAYRSGANALLEQYDACMLDLRTAQRLSTSEWTFPLYIQLIGMPDNPAELYDQLIALRPNDWFPVYSRGEMYYTLGEYDLAKADFERSVSLRPANNSPFVYTIILALREGRMADAQAAAHTILTDYPNAEQVSAMMKLVIGDDTQSGVMSAVGTSFILGQYQETLSNAGQALHPQLEEPGVMEEVQSSPNRGVIADLLMFEGLAYCNLGQIEEAETAYTEAITLNPEYKLLYLLRGSLRAQNSLDGADADFAAAHDNTLTDEFGVGLEAAQQGALTCENVFDFKP
jgi:tetratricopeptide (TPR) repeat protein